VTTGSTSNPNQRWSDGPPLPRWVLWVMLPGIVGPALIFGFILWSESAYRVERCPFHELTRTPVEDVAVVVEQGRSCVEGTEERRFLIERDGKTRVLGERRFASGAFASDHYRFTTTLTAQHEVQVVVHNEGHDDLLLREGTAEELKKGTSH